MSAGELWRKRNLLWPQDYVCTGHIEPTVVQ
jgi:hypothetical protein